MKTLFVVRMQDFYESKKSPISITWKDFDIRQRRWIELFNEHDCTTRVIVKLF